MDSKQDKAAPQELEGSSTYQDPPPPYTEAAPMPSKTTSEQAPMSKIPTQPNEQPRSADLHQPSTRSSTSSRLTKPIAIPATRPRHGSAFLRAYPPSLESYGISKDDFLRFLDDLNRVAAKSPPLQILGLAGTAVGFVPIHEAQLTGNIVELTSGIAGKIISKGMTEIHLRKANRSTFGPLGLKVEIARTNALAKLTGMPILTEKGKVSKKTNLIEPIDLNNPSSESSTQTTGQERRLQAMQPYIAHLDLASLPDTRVPTNPLGKLNLWSSESERKKGEKALEKSRSKAAKNHQKGSAKAETKHERRMAKLERRERELQQKVDSGKGTEKTERRLAKVRRKLEKRERVGERKKEKRASKKGRSKREEKRLRRLLWLVIRNVDDDSGSGPDPYTDGNSDTERVVDIGHLASVDGQDDSGSGSGSDDSSTSDSDSDSSSDSDSDSDPDDDGGPDAKKKVHKR